jgi:hypothetical protein
MKIVNNPPVPDHSNYASADNGFGARSGEFSAAGRQLWEGERPCEEASATLFWD